MNNMKKEWKMSSNLRQFPNFHWSLLVSWNFFTPTLLTNQNSISPFNKLNFNLRNWLSSSLSRNPTRHASGSLPFRSPYILSIGRGFVLWATQEAVWKLRFEDFASNDREWHCLREHVVRTHPSDSCGYSPTKTTSKSVADFDLERPISALEYVRFSNR